MLRRPIEINVLSGHSLFVYRLLNIDLFRERSRIGRVVTACRGRHYLQFPTSLVPQSPNERGL